VVADDLALDLFIAPDGALTVLDEDEFDALPIDEDTRRAARAALDDLCAMVVGRHAPFNALSG